MRSQLRPFGVRICLMIGLAGACFVCSASEPVGTEKAIAPVRQSLSELEAWLSTSNYADAWNQYLKTDLLRETLSQGSRADKKAVAEVLTQYQSDVSGLEQDRFAAVRTALKNWLAELSIVSADKLPDVARTAHTEFAPATTAQTLAAKNSTQQSAQQLNRFLSQNPAWSKQWKEFLLWNLLQEQLQNKTPDTAELAKVMQRLSANYAGLENQHFVKLRHSLRSWIDQSLAANKSEIVKKRIHSYSQELADGLADYNADSSHWDAIDIGSRAHFLERFGVAPHVTAAVRRHHSHPNLAAYVSVGLIAAAMNRKIEEPITIRENILGASISGKGHTTGSLEVGLIPNRERAVLGLHMTGTTTARTVGRKRSVQVYTNSTTELEATKHVHFQGSGFTHEPAEAIATTETDVTGLSTRRGNRLIERLAWRKVAQSQGQAERQSSLKASRRLESRMNQEGEQLINDANTKYQNKFRGPLLRKDGFPQLFEVESSDEVIRVRMHEAAASQLGAPMAVTPPPPGSDMAVRLHESFVNNMAAHLIGGTTVGSDEAGKDIETDDFLKRLKKQREEKLQERRRLEGRPEKVTKPVDTEEPPWQMRFATRNPLSVEFREGILKFTIRGIEFSGLDDQEYDRPMSLWAKYKVEIDKYGGLRLTLLDQGVDPTSVEKGQRFVAADAPLRSKLRVRWKAALEGENGENKVVEILPLELPDPRFKNVGPLAFHHMELEKGWLTVVWDRVVKKEEKQAAVDVAR